MFCAFVLSGRLSSCVTALRVDAITESSLSGVIVRDVPSTAVYLIEPSGYPDDTVSPRPRSPDGSCAAVGSVVFPPRPATRAKALGDSSAEVSGLRSPPACPTRSEEHTSELQSLAYLVCRLLLA